MLWLIIVIVAQFANAVSLFLDKFLLAKKFPRASVLTFWTALANLLGLIFIFFDFNFFPGARILGLALLSGVTSVVALQFLYLGFQTGEATHLAPLTGATLPIVSFIMSYFWLGEHLTVSQMIALALLVCGAIIISFEKSRKHNGWHIGMLWAVLAGVFFAVSYVLARGVYLETTFATGFVWARVGAFAVALPLLLMPSVRAEIFAKNKKEVQREKSGLKILAVNKICAVAYFLGINYAISIVSATIVNALAGLQYALLFILILVFSKEDPKFFKEQFTRSEIIQEVLAIVLIIIGLAILVF